jgi:NAD(P)-dependent dehydrogenase (short-subunit alcohol dehydrogenase family)
MKPYKNQVAIITGAASGLGRAIATKLAREGVKLALLYVNTERRLAVAAQLSTQTQIYPLDITDEKRVQLTKKRTI